MIRIVSPSGAIDPTLIENAKTTLCNWGFSVSEGQFARGKYGRFAGTKEERISDLQNAINDPEVNLILCSRGGYGLAQIIDKIDFSAFNNHPKLLLGLSDITILHSALAQHNIPSLHCIMAKQIAELSEDSQAKIYLREILTENKMPNYQLPTHELNRVGQTEGILRGGNLSVLYGLRATPYDLPLDEETILFIEDIGENAYHIDRMIQNLRLSGVLKRLKGLIVGQFTNCPEDPSMSASIYESIANAVSEYNYPVCFNFPAGHVDDNLPLMLGAPVSLNITSQSSELRYE